jgi:hypothetical protein
LLSMHRDFLYFEILKICVHSFNNIHALASL